MIEWKSSREGASFAVRVVPRASRNEIAGVQQGMLRIRLTAPPVEGAANKALIKLLSRALSLPKRDVEILSGHSSRTKTIRITGLTPQEIEARLLPHLPPA